MKYNCRGFGPSIRRSIQAINRFPSGVVSMIGKRPLVRFVHRSRQCEAAFAVFHCKANVGAGLVAFYAGNRPDHESFIIRREGDLRPVFFALDGFDSVVQAHRRRPRLTAVLRPRDQRVAHGRRGAVATHLLVAASAWRPAAMGCRGLQSRLRTADHLG